LNPEAKKKHLTVTH